MTISVFTSSGDLSRTVSVSSWFNELTQVSTISYISLKTTSVATYGYLSHPCYLRLQSDQSYTPEVVSGRLHVESS